MSARSKALTVTFARLSIGLILLVHGLANTFGLFGGPGLESLAREVSTHVSLVPELTTYVMAFGQLLCGLSLLLGPFSRVAAICVLVFLTASLVLGDHYSTFFVDEGGFEYLLALAALTAMVLTHGPGMFYVELGAKSPE